MEQIHEISEKIKNESFPDNDPKYVRARNQLVELAAGKMDPEAAQISPVPEKLIASKIEPDEIQDHSIQILDKAQQARKECVQDIVEPREYKTVEEALMAAGISQKAEIVEVYGMPFLKDVSGKEMGYVRGLGMALLEDGPKFLKNFRIEARLTQDSHPIPVIVAEYDLDDRYQMVLAVSSTSHQPFGETPAGRLQAYLLIDRNNGSIHDLRSLIPSETKGYIVADQADFQGERRLRCQGTTNKDRMSAGLITSADAFGSFLHETGHARYYKFLESIGIRVQFMEQVNMTKVNIGNYPPDVAMRVELLNEEAASAIGASLTGFIQDNNLRRAVNTRITAIADREKVKIKRILEDSE